jgi:hypothetical protein
VLELHQRAACRPTEPPLSWLDFVRARFLGELRQRGRSTTVAMTLQSAVLQSETVAEVRGALEFSHAGALPVVYDCAGTLNLQTQELSLEDSKAVRYEGRFSENGRVVSLQRTAAGGERPQSLDLIESGTLAELI